MHKDIYQILMCIRCIIDKHQIKHHSYPRFSATCAAHIAPRNRFLFVYQQIKSLASKVQTG